MNEVTTLAISVLVKFIIAVFIFSIYYKNKNKFAFFFSAFFLLFALFSFFRILSITTQNNYFYFISALSLMLGSVFILKAFTFAGVE